MNPGGNYIIPGSFRSRFEKDGSLNFYEILLIQVVPDKRYYLVTKNYIIPHAGTTQVKVAILQPGLFFNLFILID